MGDGERGPVDVLEGVVLDFLTYVSREEPARVHTPDVRPDCQRDFVRGDAVRTALRWPDRNAYVSTNTLYSV